MRNSSSVPLTREQGSDAVALVEGERKIVTALFADIKGSTEIMRDLDPEEARAIIDPVLRLMIDAVHRQDGYVVQSAGDGIFALFGAPVAHEDHPERAVRAALAMREALSQLHKAFEDRPPINVRIGINTGELVLRTVHTGGHTEYTPVGYTANLAARMQSVAPAGEIVISESTRHQVEGYFQLRHLGPTEVRGLDRPINVYQVIDAERVRGHFDLAVRRGLTKFVGREREIVELNRVFELSRGGRGQIVALVAEPGTGKSRLIHEFKLALPPSCKVLEAHAVSHGRASAWLPLLELMRGYFRFREFEHESNRRDKVRAALSALDPCLSEAGPYLFTLLGIQDDPDPLAQMDPRIRRERTLDALKRILVRESLNQPIILIFEDLHWIDEETQAFLDALADSVSNVRTMLLVSYRPEYRHGWSNRSYYAQLRLNTLEPENAEVMLSALLGMGAELDALKRVVIDRTNGNPFFIEEMVQALFDEGVLERDGAVKVRRSLAQLRLPPTVQAVLAARIDRLASNQKEFLQTLAVIGRASSLPIIKQIITIADSDLAKVLTDLQAIEFIYEKQTAFAPEWVFKHALTQEVAYNSVLLERRKLLHERTAGAIEKFFASNLVDHYTELAHHYRLSGNREEAIKYLRLAGQQAVERSANSEAVSFLKSALNLLVELPDTQERAAHELTLHIALGPALQASKGWAASEVEQVYSRAFELCQQLGESPQIYPALFGLQAFYVHRGKLRRALELANQGLNLAQSLQDPGLILEAQHMLAYNLTYLGEFGAAREHARQGIALYDPKYHSLAFSISGDDAGVCCLCFHAMALWGLGYPDRALNSVCDAISLAEKLCHPLSQALALSFAAIVHQLRRERKSVQERADACIALCNDQGFPFFLGLAKMMRGWAVANEGEADGIAEMHEGLNAYRRTGADSFRPYHLALIAEGYNALTQPDEALRAISEALDWIEHADERFYEPELYRLKGMLLLRTEGTSGEWSWVSQVQSPKMEIEAERLLRKAMDAARKQSAKSQELRSAIGLAHLLRQRGDRVKARALLADTYNWFTEGFDTADLKDAKALLDQLSS